MSVVRRMPSPLTSTGPRFERHCDSALNKKLSKSSLHLFLWSSSVPCVSPWRPECNEGCPTVICSSRYMTNPIPFDISYFGFFTYPLTCFTISPVLSVLHVNTLNLKAHTLLFLNERKTDSSSIQTRQG